MQARQARFGGLALAAGLLASSAQAAVVISSDPTLNMTCNKKQVCSPQEANAVLNVNDLQALLATGNVRVTTTGSAEAGNLKIESGLSWASSSALTLDAKRGIRIDQPVSVTGTSGLVMNDGGVGNLTFGKNGSVSFRDTASTLSINRQRFLLEANLPSLIAAIQDRPKGSYALAASYDASADGTYRKTPIRKPFDGTFEGLGNAISNFTLACGRNGCRRDSGKALFQTITGTVENLRLLNIGMDGNGSQAGAGGLVAELSGIVRAVQVTGQIGGFQDGGGLALEARGGTILNSSTAVSITLGLANLGVHAGGLVDNCTGDGVNPTVISQSSATGAIDVGGGGVSKGATGGGLVAAANGGCQIDQSFATGSVKLTANGAGGGLVGTSVDGSTVVTNSYATGNVIGDRPSVGFALGGLSGTNEGNVSTSYSTGDVALVEGVDNGIGGLIGQDNTSPPTTKIASAVFDTTTSGQSQCIGLEEGSNDGSGCVGLTSDQLKAGLPTGFDSTIWAVDPNGAINGGFPYLINNPPPQ